jgi:arsenate reductase-like glutaredoxin family protein
MTKKQALELASDVDELYVCKGKTVVHLDLKRDKPDTTTLASLLLGPTGNLRAPTLRKGRTLVVGFDESMYRTVFHD